MVSSQRRVILYFDGASRNNPRGPSGCGFHMVEMDEHGADGKRTVAHGSKFLGHNVSNNEAEYIGLICGLKRLRCRNDIEVDHLYIRGDSEIIIKQLQGEYRVRSARLKPYYNEVMSLLQNLNYTAKHIDRSKNHQADSHANRAIRIHS